MTDSGIFHFNEYFLFANLVETYWRELEWRLWLGYDESLGFDICKRHDVAVSVYSIFPLLFPLSIYELGSQQ